MQVAQESVAQLDTHGAPHIFGGLGSLAPDFIGAEPAAYPHGDLALESLLRFSPKTDFFSELFCGPQTEHSEVVPVGSNTGPDVSGPITASTSTVGSSDTDHSPSLPGQLGNPIVDGYDYFFDPKAWSAFADSAKQVSGPTIATTAAIGGTILLGPGVPGLVEASIPKLLALIADTRAALSTASGFISALRGFDASARNGMRSFGRNASPAEMNRLPLNRRWSFGSNGWISESKPVGNVVHIAMNHQLLSAYKLRLIEALRLAWFRSFFKPTEGWRGSQFVGLMKEWAAYSFANRNVVKGLQQAARDPSIDLERALLEAFMTFSAIGYGGLLLRGLKPADKSSGATPASDQSAAKRQALDESHALGDGHRPADRAPIFD